MLTTLLLSVGGLVGTGVGAWIAAMFVPSFALLLKSALDFLRSPLGTLLGVGALCAFLFVSGWIGGDVHGTTATRAAWRAENTARERAQAARELTLHLNMRREADAAITADDQFGKSIDGKVQKNESENSDRSACRAATGADIGRLLSIH
jgi:hypothetical protein